MSLPALAAASNSAARGASDSPPAAASSRSDAGKPPCRSRPQDARRRNSATSALCLELQRREPQAHVELELVIRRLHVRAERIERLVVLALLQVRQLVHHDHLQERRRRLLEQAGDPDLALGLEPVALHPRHRGVRAQGVAHDVQLLVVLHLRQRRGVAQKACLELAGVVVEGAVGLDVVAFGVAPAHGLGQAAFGDELAHLGQEARADSRPGSGASGVAAQLAQHEQVQALDLLARPRRAAQEGEARLDARVAQETAHRDALGQAGPAVVGDEGGEDRFQGEAVEGVAGLVGWLVRSGHDAIFARYGSMPRARDATKRPAWQRRSPTTATGIDLAAKLATFSEPWQPRVVGQFNGHDLMVAKLKGEFTWHKHDDTDDFFLVLKGSVTIRMHREDVTLGGESLPFYIQTSIVAHEADPLSGRLPQASARVSRRCPARRGLPARQGAARRAARRLQADAVIGQRRRGDQGLGWPAPSRVIPARFADVVVVLHAFQKKTQARPRDAFAPETIRFKFATEAAAAVRRTAWQAKCQDYMSRGRAALINAPSSGKTFEVEVNAGRGSQIVKESGWTQTAAADQCGVTQPRMNDLLRGRVSRFSLDALVNIATAIGRRVHFELEAA